MLESLRDRTLSRRIGRRSPASPEAGAQPGGNARGGDQPEQGRQPEEPGPVRDVVVSRAGVRDLVGASRLATIVPLNLPEQALCRHAAVPSPLELITGPAEERPVVLAGHGHGQLLGFATFRPVAPDLRWQLMTVGSAAAEPVAIWADLLDGGTRTAGEHGVKRLYARAPVESDIGLALRASGYAAYTREMIFVSREPRPLSDGIAIREQDRADTWAVHQLYNSVVPREVLYAEAFTSHRWELPQGRLRSRPVTRAWICEADDAPVAYARCLSTKRGHVLDLLSAPGSLMEVALMLDELFIRLGRSGTIEVVYCAVRAYSREIERLLLERGFSPWLEQEHFVRYTTAPLRVMTAETVLSESEALERRKQRVPAYFWPGDFGPRSESTESRNLPLANRRPS
jgi:hypothetical protein